MASTTNSDVNSTFGGRVWITGKLRGDQKMTVIVLGELIIFLSFGGFSAPGGSHCCSYLIASQNRAGKL
jgi:hypothetical protein